MSRGEVIARGLALITDTLFPLFCLGCGQEGCWLCPRCRQTLRTPGVFSCPFCHQPRPEGWRCADCAPATYVDQHVALDKYNEMALLGRLIDACKYQYLSGVVSELRPLIQEFFYCYGWLMPGEPTVVVPVPLHPRRQAERGFNQARLIAEIVARALNRLVVDALERHRYTRQQARLKKADRIKNVEGAFRLVGTNLASRQIILVDDVYTTGSTMQECARVLKAAGALSVTAFTLARG